MAAPTPHDDPADLHRALTGHLDWLRGLAAHLVRDGDDADDLVQDTLVAALRRPPALNRPLRPWLAGVLRRLHLERRRKAGRRARREQAAAREDATPASDELVERLELGERLIAAVRALPEPYRTTVALRYREGLEPKDIAARLGVPGGTVRWRLREGLSRLRAQLDEAYGERRAWVALALPLAEAGAPVLAGPPAAPASAASRPESAIGSPPEPASTTAPPASVASALAPLGIAGAAALAALIAAWGLGFLGGSPPELDGPSVALERASATDDGGRTRSGATAAPRRRPVDGAALDPAAAESRDVDPDPPADVARARVDGRVVVAGGVPAPGVEVIAIPAAPYALDAGSPSIGGREVLGRTATDGRGAFTLAGLPDALVQLVARDVDERRAVSPPVRAEERAREPLVLRLAEPDSADLDAAAIAGEIELGASDGPRRASEDPPRASEDPPRASDPPFGPATPTAPESLIERRCSGSVRWSGPDPAPPLALRVRRGFPPSTVALRSGFRVLWRAPDSPAVPVAADGRFELSARFEAREAQVGLELLRADGRSLGVQAIDVMRLGPGLQLPAGPLATLTLDVALDPLETVPPRFVAVSAGDGVVHAAAIRPDEPPELAGLPAGAYELGWFRDDPTDPHVDGGTTAFLRVDAGPRSTAFALTPGEARRLHLDRRGLPLLELDLAIDGESAERWSVQLTPPPTPAGTPDRTRFLALSDATGRIQLRLEREGRYLLRLEPSLDTAGPRYRRELELDTAGARVELEPAVVTGVWSSGPLAEPAWLRTAFPDGGVWTAPIESFADGTFRIERAALGAAEVVRAASAAEAFGAPPLAALTVPSGGLADVRLP